MSVSFTLANEDQTALLGQYLAQTLQPILLTHDFQNRAFAIFLQGDLGAGKTTLTRSILRAFDYTDTVKSPTYTIVESYKLPKINVELFHFDLYRLLDPEELELMGIRDYFAKNALCLIEWPDRGQGFLPEADLIVDITHLQEGRQVQLSSKVLDHLQLQTIADKLSA